MKSDKSTSKCERIIYISHYYPPECNAPANRVNEFARHWARSGRRVSVITGMPHHPNGRIPDTYRHRWYCREETDGVVVHRGRIYPTANRGVYRRALNYLSFMISAIVVGLWKAGPVDCVVATSPQFLTAVAGWILASVRRAQFVFEIRDVWPEEIVTVGAIRNRFVIRLLELVEMFLYRRADHLVVVSEGSLHILQRRGISGEKISVIPNGVDTEAFTPGDKHNGVRRTLKLNGEFVAAYIGTVGMAHRLDVILDTAQRLKDRPDIRFLIVGDGAERARLIELSERMALTNVRWEPLQPRNRIAEYYRAADACIVHLRKAELFTKNIPSKMYEVMASGRPMLLGTLGESQALGVRAGCAQCFAPENSDALADAILQLSDDRAHAERLGRAGRLFVETQSNLGELAMQYLTVIDSTAAARTESHTKSS